MPVTRVVDWHGATVHDCADAGCEVSWDALALRAGVQAQTGVDQVTGAPVLTTYALGAKLPGAGPLPPGKLAADGKTYTLARPANG